MRKCICRYDNSTNLCNICNGTGKDNRTWYILVGWSENSYTGYHKFTSDLNLANKHVSEGMELYGSSDSLDGIRELETDFYDKGGWFYR